MAWYHSHTLPGQCMSYRSLRRGSTISSRVESCSCELEVQAVARRLHGMFSLHHAQHAAILRSHAPTIPRMHSVFSDRSDGSSPPQSPDRELELIGKGRQEHTFACRGFGGTRRDGTEGGCGRRFWRADEGGRWRGWGRAKH